MIVTLAGEEAIRAYLRVLEELASLPPITILNIDCFTEPEIQTKRCV